MDAKNYVSKYQSKAFRYKIISEKQCKMVVRS